MSPGRRDRAPEISRQAHIERNTKETQIVLTLNLDGTGAAKVDTGIPFFNHMLEAWSKHALMDLAVDAKGDLDVDLHHPRPRADLRRARCDLPTWYRATECRAVSEGIVTEAGIVTRWNRSRAPVRPSTSTR